MRKFLIHRAPSSLPILKIIAPFFLPKLSFLINSFSNTTFQILILLKRELWISLIKNNIFDWYIYILKIRFPYTSFDLSWLFIYPLMFHSFLNNFLIGISLVEFSQIWFNLINFKFSFFDWQFTIFKIFHKKEIISWKWNITGFVKILLLLIIFRRLFFL